MQTTWIILVLCAIFTASSEAAFGKHTKHDKIVKRRIRGNFFMTGGAGASFPRRALLQVLGGTAVGLPFLGEIYARLGGGGADYSVNIPFTDVPQSWGDIEDVTIVFHGAGGQDAYTDELMQNLKKSGDQKKSYETIIDWSDLSSNILQASFNGQRYGRFVAAQIMKETKQFKKLKTVHFIGISVGAFAADAAVKEFKEGSSADRHNSVVQLTLLDPFAQRGVIGPRYGDRNFGISADYAQQFLNTDDPVPSTNAALSNCACTDVTELRPPSIFGHDWPLVYYSRSGRFGIVPEADRRPAGSVLRLSQ